MLKKELMEPAEAMFYSDKLGMVLQPRGAWRHGVVGAHRRQQLQQQASRGARVVLMRLTSTVRNLGKDDGDVGLSHMPRPSPKLTNGSAIPWPSCGRG